MLATFISLYDDDDDDDKHFSTINPTGNRVVNHQSALFYIGLKASLCFLRNFAYNFVLPRPRSPVKDCCRDISQCCSNEEW